MHTEKKILKKNESRPVWNPNAALVNTWGHLVLQFWFYFLYKIEIIECEFYLPKVFKILWVYECPL